MVNPIFSFTIFNDNLLNQTLNQQLSGLVLAVITLFLIFTFANDVRLGYLNFNRNGKMKADNLIFLKEENRWEDSDWSFGIIMVAIMGFSSFFMANSIGFDFNIVNLMMVIPFAATNAFTEEVIFTLSYITIGANETNSSFYVRLMGAIIFGLIHYWGLFQMAYLVYFFLLTLVIFYLNLFKKLKGSIGHLWFISF
jgi:hypothetical protein